MITVLSANFAQLNATQTELWCKLNYQIEPKTIKGKCKTKRHKGDAKNATNQAQ